MMDVAIIAASCGLLAYIQVEYRKALNLPPYSAYIRAKFLLHICCILEIRGLSLLNIPSAEYLESAEKLWIFRRRYIVGTLTNKANIIM